MKTQNQNSIGAASLPARFACFGPSELPENAALPFYIEDAANPSKVGPCVVARVRSREEGERIVRACNSHAALVEALELAAKQFDSIVAALSQGHTVSVSSVQNCAAQARNSARL